LTAPRSEGVLTIAVCADRECADDEVLNARGGRFGQYLGEMGVHR
jgi:hypothetical protein